MGGAAYAAEVASHFSGDFAGAVYAQALSDEEAERSGEEDGMWEWWGRG